MKRQAMIGGSSAASVASVASVAVAKGSRGQGYHPLLHVTQLMLPPLSALRAPLCSAPALATGCSIFAAILGLQLIAGDAIAAERVLLGNLPGDQDSPAIAIGSAGGYVAWEDNRLQTGGDPKGIAAAAVSPGLATVGEVFRVSSQVEGKQERPQVTALASGAYLFTFEIRNGAKPGVYARLLGTNGAFAGNEVLVSKPTVRMSNKVSTNWTASYRGVVKSRKHRFKEQIINTREQAGAASVVALADGGALVAYHAMRRSDTNTWGLETRTLLRKGEFIEDSVLRPLRSGNDWMHDIFVQRLDALGNRVGEEILVNQTVDYNQRTPALTVLADGKVVVSWVTESSVSMDWRKNFQVGVVARVLDVQGQPVTDEFALGNVEDRAQANPALTTLTSGGFMACWSQQEGVGRGWDVYARAFLADGSATGPSFRVNTHTAGEQFGPRVAGVGDGALVVWTSVGQDGSREGVYGRRVLSGALSGDEFRVNDTTASRQWHPIVSADGAGGAAVVWSSFVGESGFDLFSATTRLSAGE